MTQDGLAVEEVTQVSRRYLEELLRLANKSDMKQKHAAILVDQNGRIISRGWNRWLRKTSDNQRFAGLASIHAEERALINAHPDTDYKKTTLIVIRLLGNGRLGRSCPCKRCGALIDNFKVKKVRHS